LLFVEIGATPADDLFLEVEYDGAIHLRSTNEGNRPFAVLADNEKIGRANDRISAQTISQWQKSGGKP
jgi:hypothetical protein